MKVVQKKVRSMKRFGQEVQRGEKNFKCIVNYEFKTLSI